MATSSITTPTVPTNSVGPITPNERIQVVDILRGFALFGILLVNMAVFKMTLMPGVLSASAEHSLIDQLAIFVVHMFGEGKFFTLFSFLFGFGFSIQMMRAQQRDVPFVPRFMRRLFILLGIGLLHALLIWYGDILVSYALIGVILILFRNHSPRALLIWATILLVGITLLMGICIGLIEFGRATPEGLAAIEQAEVELLAQTERDSARDLAIYGSGNYLEIVAERARDYREIISGIVVMFPIILAMFMLGLYASKRGILHNIAQHQTLLRRVRFWGLSLGLLLNGVMVFAIHQLSLFSGMLAEVFFLSIAGPLLSMGYAATIVLLTQHDRWRNWLTPLGFAGRMALTNYLMQSLICTTIFYGYGFGLFGEVGAAIGILLTIIIYALQIPFSVWWLNHFQFGPMEWIWRTLTYGQPQPMRLVSHRTPSKIGA